jgi:hypothetical protein
MPFNCEQSQRRYGGLEGDRLPGQSGELKKCPRPSGRNVLILTDLSGPFFTVVSEAEYDSFSAWEANAQAIFGDARFAAWFERMTLLVESGRREFYNLIKPS